MPFASMHGMLEDRSIVAAGILLSTLLGGCRGHGDDDAERTALSRVQVLSSGRFAAVGKPTSGSVELRARGDDYELCLVNVKIAYDGPVHVYLVGLDDAPTTAAVDNAELKYDMGPLRVGKEQCIALPTAPHPLLRSVVLWNPMYGANLAAARLLD